MKKIKKLETAPDYFQEAFRYYQNAKEQLKETKIELGFYTDTKPLREAAAVAYLAVLSAVNGYLLGCGFQTDKLPKSIDEYLRALRKYGQRNGSLLKYFNRVYHNLHILGYYRDDLYDMRLAKIAFADAKWLIEHLTGKKV